MRHPRRPDRRGQGARRPRGLQHQPRGSDRPGGRLRLHVYGSLISKGTNRPRGASRERGTPESFLPL
ncbi:protein of unknown function [Magnetospirillum sp. XM-1]|nr:protein of unknown function [Magnetospirillum sp. XM-1]